VTAAEHEARQLSREEWEAYRDQLAEWSRQWDDYDAVPPSERVPPASQNELDVLGWRWRFHPDFRGMTSWDVVVTLRRRARDAIAERKLYSALPIDATIAERAAAGVRVAALDVEWSWFGGEQHKYMTARQLQDHFRACAKGAGGDWHTLDFAVVAENRQSNEYYKEALKRPDFSLHDWAKEVVEGKRFPDETNAANLLRRTRVPALLLVVAASVGALVGVPAAGQVAAGALIYLAASYLLYPGLVGERWVKRYDTQR
jgi:hypothetical protein